MNIHTDSSRKVRACDIALEGINPAVIVEDESVVED